MKKSYKLQDLCCANCASKIEFALNKLDCVDNATVNIMTQKLVLETKSENLEHVLLQAQNTIKKYEPKCKIIL